MMIGRELFAKRWNGCLLVSVLFLTLFVSGCQRDSHVQNQPAVAEPGKKIEAEASPQYDSDTSPEDCLVCGDGKGTALPLYRGQLNVGIVNLNSFDLAPVTVNRYDDSGELIEKSSKGSATHITSTGRDGFFLSVTADTNRGYANGHLSFDKSETLDMDMAASHLCSDCLNRTMDNCWSDDPLSMGVINFSTGEIRLFEEKILAFTFGDYYISCDRKDKDDEDMRDIDLLIFYCPDRYQD